MPTCAFVPCAEADHTTCPLPGGCVVTRFKDQPRYKAKTFAEAEGIKVNARKGDGPVKGKAPKKR